VSANALTGAPGASARTPARSQSHRPLSRPPDWHGPHWHGPRSASGPPRQYCRPHRVAATLRRMRHACQVPRG